MADWDDDDFEVAPVKLTTEEEDLAAMKKAEEEALALKISSMPKEAKVKIAAPKTVLVNSSAPSGPLTSEEKRRIEEEQKQGDFELAQDLFAGAVRPSKKGTAINLGHEVTFETFKPKTEADFDRYAKYISERIVNFQNDSHYLFFVKNLLKTLANVNAMSAEDVKELSGVLNVIQNDKIKSQKTVKKKAGSTKKTLNVESKAGQEVEDNFDDFDDFM